MNINISKLVTTKEEVFEIMDEFYFLYYEKGQILHEIVSEEAPIVLSAVREMLEFWDDDGEEIYKIKQHLIVEDLKTVIPPKEYPELWV